ncbi:MAG TPA: MarR family winged helix-turn-helix transcriptional regulator [Jatrophihabitans sp.]|nr:MarR family winged helix-turn-helix transcriptional regulator [Jatrophihabitans sp.]
MPSERSRVERIDTQVEAIMTASRVLMAVSAESLAAADETVTPQQVRALVAIASQGTMTATGFAAALGVHASSATRMCDRLVAVGLLDRRDDPADRRYLMLDLTERGRAVVAAIMRQRRTIIKQILTRIPEGERPAVTAAFQRFAAAGGEAAARDLWLLGWQT